MGQRHQVFLIARVRPHGSPPDHPGRRRCIAACHHQWCYASLPLAATRRLVTLLKNPENALIIREELRAIDGKYGAYGAAPPNIPDIPCPFVASILCCAWTTDLDRGDDLYTSGTTLTQDILPAGMGCWDGDNNDGITVVDITDLENPAYCFFDSRGSDKPLDAREYLSRYEPVAELESVDATSLSTPDKSAGNKRKKYLLRTIRSLQDVPLLDAGMVEEAWPTTRKSANSHVAATAEPPSIPSFVDSTLEKAVAQALTTDGGQADLEMLLYHPGKAADIMNVLRTMNPIPPKAVELLSRIVQGVGGTTSPRVDISKFQLTRDQIIHILLSIHATQETLDLSNNTVLVASDVPTIVAAAGPALRRIVLMGCSSIENASLLSLVQECPPELKSLESILHPAFFTITKPYPYPSAFTFVNVRKNGSLACASIPMFTPAHVIQAVTDAIPWRVASETKWGSPGMPPMLVDHALPLAGCSALQGGLRKSEMGFDQRTVVTVPHLTPKVPREEKNLWTFVLRVSTWMGEHEGWAFVRLIPRGAPAASSSDCADEVKGHGPLVLLHEAYSGQVYDLHGFLKYMEDEGRPMPAEDAVEKLQTLLDARDEETGEACCPFLNDLTVAGIEGRYDPIQMVRYSEWGFAL